MMYFDASRFKTLPCINDLQNKSCRYQKVPWCCLFIHGDDYKNKNLGPYAAIAGQRAYNKMIREAKEKKTQVVVTEERVTKEGKEEEDVVVSEASIINTSPVVLPKLSQDVPVVLRDIITTTQVDPPQWIWPPLPELEAVSYDMAVKAITEYLKERQFFGVVCSICGDTTDVTPHHYKCGCSDYFCKNHFMLVMHINVKCQNQLCPCLSPKDWC